MDNTTIAGVGGTAIAIVFAVLGYMLKRSVAQMDQKQKEHDDELKAQSKAFDAYKLHVAEHYVTTNELTKAIDALNETVKGVFARFDRLEQRFDARVDK